ncbi:unnamed protein product [Rotaria sp. Silwood1]|nr:unnamed protein product [Rotaria sp. Silwood1]CAF3380563.1 unnamed protein product [Rotaria sp. Silwood1]CAF4954805.1 unnamed protein product [Rotaria sp. Silwood1]
MAIEITISSYRPLRCSFACNHHGECVKYINHNDENSLYYCRCDPGWSGKDCTIKHDTCNLCARDSLCMYQNICICPLGKEGSRCYLKSTTCSSSLDRCQNGGLCIPSDMRRRKNNIYCLCPEGFSNQICSKLDLKVRVEFHSNIEIPQSIIIYLIQHTIMTTNKPVSIYKKIPFDQNSISFYTPNRFFLAFMALSMNEYYLTYTIHDNNSLMNENNRRTILMRVQSDRRCRHVRELLNRTLISLHLLRRIKYYQLPCKQQWNLACFYDEKYMCYCTNRNESREAQCFTIGHNEMNSCQGMSNGGCLNGARCFQDQLICPTMVTCVCAECFYGTHCQFTTQGFGLSLDAILGYHIQSNVPFLRQPLVIKVSALLVTIMVIIGLLGNLLSILTFHSKTICEVGCGLYLFANAIISLLTIVFLMAKFSLLVLSQMTIIVQRSFLIFNCRSMDFILGACLSMGDWLSGCVAIERAFVTYKRTSFNKTKSRKIARWIILVVCSVTLLTRIYDPIHRNLLDDNEEQRIWCMITYNSFYQMLNSTITMFHFTVPFAINLISALFIIFMVARQRAFVHKEQTYKQHILQQFRRHQHIIISPCILTALAISRLIFSFLPGCMNSPRNPWLFFIAYIISFMPSTLMFVVYILPSKIYRGECRNVLTHISQRLYSR